MGRELVKIDKINYKLYKEFKSEIEIYCHTYGYWCSDIILLEPGHYIVFGYGGYNSVVCEEDLSMYVPKYFLELFTDLKNADRKS